MSRSNNTEVQNPCSLFLQWSSENKCFSYYEKFDQPDSEGNKGKTKLVKLPLSFVVLDTLSTIKGFNDDDKSGYWSNEIKDISKDILTVRTKKGIAATGTYKEVMAELRDAKYAASVYVGIIKKDGTLGLANLQLVGASVSAWFDFLKDNRQAIYKDAVTCNDFVEGKKGKTIYYSPVFELKRITEEQNNQAIAIDQELQEYLEAYLKIKNTGIEEEITKGEASKRLHEEPPPPNDAPPEQEDNSPTAEELEGDIPF